VNDVGELKEYVRVHARGQRISGYQDVLDQIHTDEHGAPGSWVGEWCRAAEALEGRGRDLEAARHYAMARFPYVDGPARQEALERCVRALDRWRSGRHDIERLDLELKEGTVGCWASGLSATDRKPLLVVMGGIVTIKEQWAPMLANMRRLGMAGVVAEMPGVGENPLRYGPESGRMLSGLLDAVADRADVTQTHAIALSFSGHMALRCALNDHRIRSVITVGAPVGEFFTDIDWQRRLPQITVDTLAHISGIAADEVAGGLGDWALTEEELGALDIPVCYVASRHDEIIPAGDIRLLKEHVRDLRLVENDDVHGSPRYVHETQLWTVASLLRARGVHNLQSAIIGLLLRWRRLSRGAAGSRD
jgi:esterase FrsA